MALAIEEVEGLGRQHPSGTRLHSEPMIPEDGFVSGDECSTTARHAQTLCTLLGAAAIRGTVRL